VNPNDLPAAHDNAPTAADLDAARRLLARLGVVAYAENDGHLPAGDNPARKVAKPRRLPSTRRAVPDTRLAEINHIAATTVGSAAPPPDGQLLRYADGRPITSRRYDHLRAAGK